MKELESGKDQQLLTGLSGSARAVFINMLYNVRQKAMLIVAPNLLHAQKLTEDLVKLVGEDLVRLYPADELIAADISIASPELRAAAYRSVKSYVNEEKWNLYRPYCWFEKTYANRKGLA